MSPSRSLLLALALAATTPLPVVGSWVKLKTPDFELYTSAGEKKGRDAIEHFEQVRAFFLQASPIRQTSEAPVRIIEFDSRKQYRPWAPNEFTAAYFLSTPARDYIVIGDANLDFSVSTHEYVHLIVRRSGLHLPVWLNEGWAEVYSSLRPVGKEVAVGDLLQNRVNELNRANWMNLDELTSVTAKSPEYNEASRVGIFYAESWALAHMLYLSPQYQEGFGKFLMAIHQGKPFSAACLLAWDRSSAQVFSDLKSYFDRKKLLGRIFETHLDNARQEPAVTEVSDFDSRLVLADLFVSIQRNADAKTMLATLESEKPGTPEVARSLGFLAAQTGDREAARSYFRKAFDGGETDPQMCYLLALFDNEAKQPPASVIPVLERALKSKPDFTDAAIQLGLMKLAARDYSGGIATLTAIPSITADRAPAVYCNLTSAYIHTGDLTAARENRDICAKFAKGPGQSAGVEELTRLLEARAAPEAGVRPGEQLKRVTGALQNIDCSVTPKKLQVLTANGPALFDLPDPAAVELTGKRTSFSFACGPQSGTPAAIEFAPPRTAMEKLTGIVRAIQF